MSELLERAKELLDSPALELPDGYPSKFDWFLLRDEWLKDYSATPKRDELEAENERLRRALKNFIGKYDTVQAWPTQADVEIARAALTVIRTPGREER